MMNINNKRQHTAARAAHPSAGAVIGLVGLFAVAGAAPLQAATASTELRSAPLAVSQGSLPDESADARSTGRLPAEAVFFLDPQFDGDERVMRGKTLTDNSGPYGLTPEGRSSGTSVAVPAVAGFSGALWSIAAAGALLLAAFNARKRRYLVRG